MKSGNRLRWTNVFGVNLEAARIDLREIQARLGQLPAALRVRMRPKLAGWRRLPGFLRPLDGRANAIEQRLRGIFSLVTLEDGAVAIDEEIGGEGVDAIAAGRLALGVEALLPGHAVLGDEIVPGVLVAVFADADDFDLIAAKGGLEALEVGQGVAARTAPGSPEIEEREFSA